MGQGKQVPFGVETLGTLLVVPSRAGCFGLDLQCWVRAAIPAGDCKAHQSAMRKKSWGLLVNHATSVMKGHHVAGVSANKATKSAAVAAAARAAPTAIVDE